MKNPFDIFLLWVGAIALFSGCEKFLDYKGENAKPRLVVNGAFAPDSIFSAELSTSLGYIENGTLPAIANGSVVIFDNAGTPIDTLQHISEGIYRGAALAEANKMYSIEASAPGFEAVSASDIAPSPVGIDSWSTNIISVTEYDYTSEKLELSFSIADPVDISNYYYLELYTLQSYYISYGYNPQTQTETYDTIYYPEPFLYEMSFSTADPLLTASEDLALDQSLYFFNGLAFDDEIFDGKTQTFQITVEYYNTELLNQQLKLRLTSCSESYYKYRKTLNLFYNTDGDPFAQPVQVYTNINDNGLGIWAGYSISNVIIE